MKSDIKKNNTETYMIQAFLKDQNNVRLLQAAKLCTQ